MHSARSTAVWRIESAEGAWPASRGWCATSASPRSWRRTRWSRRSEHWPDVRRARQPGRLADDHRQAPRARLVAPGGAARAQARGSSAATLERAGDHVVPDIAEALAEADGDEIGDDLLRLIFTACHPVLSTEARVALTLKLLGGLTHRGDRARLPGARADRSRSASCAPSARWPQAKVPFEVPRGDELRRAPGLGARGGLPASSTRATPATARRRLDAPGADARTRCAWAACWPSSRRDDSEVHGLVALMELQASRAAARVDAQGRPVLLSDQDRTRWDRLLIRRGLAALDRARALAVAARQPHGPTRCRPRSRACHARRGDSQRHRLAEHRRRSTTRWRKRVPSPVVQLNRRGGGGHGVRAGGGARDRRRGCRTTARCATTSGCPACAPICWPSSAVTTRPAPS